MSEIANMPDERTGHAQTTRFKAKVAVAAIKGEKMMAELSQEFDVYANQIKQWKDQLLYGATTIFGEESRPDEKDSERCWRRRMPNHGRMLLPEGLGLDGERGCKHPKQTTENRTARKRALLSKNDREKRPVKRKG